MSKKPKTSDLRAKLLFYSPVVAGAFFLFVMIVHYGVNTPFWDQWDMVSIFQKVSNHTLGFSDLWHQHNEHRIFFPLLILLANAYLTGWNTGIEMLISLFFAILTVLLIFMLLDKSIQKNHLKLLSGVLIAAWFFSPVQWQNWLWGGQLVWFICNLAAVVAVVMLVKLPNTASKNRSMIFFGSALVAGFTGTFSLASGLFVWPVGLLLLFIIKQPKKVLAIWAGVGAITIGLYYYHLSQTPTPSGSAELVFFHQPIGFLKFFLALMGGPVGSWTGGGLEMAVPGGAQLTYIVGGLLLIPLIPLSYCVWQRRNNILLYAPWLAIIVYCLLCVTTTAYGRLGYGMDLVYKSRYTSFTVLYVIAVVALTFTIISSTNWLNERHKMFGALIFSGLILPLLISSYVVGFHGFKTQSELLLLTKSCTHASNPTDACLAATYPKPWVVRPRLEYVKNRHWAGY